VHAARDADEARLLFRKHLPDPSSRTSTCRRDGLIVHEFRLDPVGGSIPIVALTAQAMRGDRERFLAGGCTGYIAKPIETKTFVSEVRAYLTFP
jgi:CheY-like chemotaxis protein